MLNYEGAYVAPSLNNLPFTFKVRRLIKSMQCQKIVNNAHHNAQSDIFKTVSSVQQTITKPKIVHSLSQMATLTIAALVQAGKFIGGCLTVFVKDNMNNI